MAKKTLLDYMSNPNANFQVLPRSVRVTDNNGKLLGIVTNISRMDSLQSNKKFDVVKKLANSGIPNDSTTQKNFLVNGKDVYAIDNGKILSLEQYKNKLTTRGAGSTKTSGTGK